MVSCLPMQYNNIKLFAQGNPKHCFTCSGRKPLHSLGVPMHALGRVGLCGPALSSNAASAAELDPKEGGLSTRNYVQSLAKYAFILL